MNKLNDFIRQLDEVDIDENKDIELQGKLFEQYIFNNEQHANIRQQLYEEYKNGNKITGPNGLRKKLGAIDLAYFGRAYLPHYFQRESPAFHAELDEMWINDVCKNINVYKAPKEVNDKDGCRQAKAAPRGHAKSTNVTFKDDIHAILYEYKHYILILSDSSDQAQGFLGDIRSELEDNIQIKEDFGELKGDKYWNVSGILTNTNIKVEAIGSGKKIRGRKHKQWRPDLIVLDDVENDENINTPEQRKKLLNWFDKAVSNAGDTYTDIIIIGTILHFESLLAKIMIKPQYKSQKYRAINSYAKNESLWDEWEKIYTDLENQYHQEDAIDFFKEHEQQMLEGTKVLWEEKLSYYKLMVTKIDIGDAAFNSEYQNDPIDPDNCTFNEEWFDFYDETQVNFTDKIFLFVGSNDPSLGKNKKSDTSAIIALAKDTVSGYMYVVEASIERRKPDVIIEDAIETSRRLKKDYKKPFTKFGVETVQFQYYFKDIMVAKSAEAGEYLPIEEIQSTQNKQARIESLQPFIKNGYIKFNIKHKTLMKQLKEYPMGKNDDGPDALEMAVRLAISIKGGTARDYKTVIKRGLRFKKGAY